MRIHHVCHRAIKILHVLPIHRTTEEVQPWAPLPFVLVVTEVAFEDAIGVETDLLGARAGCVERGT